MGRQINFYFDEEDENEFLQASYLNDVVFLKSDVKKPQNELFDQFNFFPYLKSAKLKIYLCFNRELRTIKYRKVEKHGFYYIDATRSHVIEFCRSGLNKESNILISGRLWVEMKYWDTDKKGNDIYVSKSKELEELYNNLVKWIRKYCKRLPKGKYIGPHAMKLYEAGAELSP